MSALAFNTTNRKCVLASENYISTLGGVTITTENITGFVSGFGTDNLKNDDPYTPVKTNGVSTSPAFIFDLGTAKQAYVVAIVNHNLKSQGYTSVTFEYDSSGVPTWAAGGTWNLKTGDATAMAFWGGNVYQKYRLKFNGASANFMIGNIYVGGAHICTTNPAVDGFVQTVTSGVRLVNSAGDAKHAIVMRNKPTSELQMEFQYQHADDAEYFRTISAGQFVGVVPPEYSDSAHLGPDGQPFFWGYVTEVEYGSWEVGSIGNDTHRYTCAVRMEGGL